MKLQYVIARKHKHYTELCVSFIEIKIVSIFKVAQMSTSSILYGNTEQETTSAETDE